MNVIPVKSSNPAPVTVARTLGHMPGEMNGYERAWATHLNRLIGEGKVHSWKFEPLTLRLSRDRNRDAQNVYTPDFLVILADGQIEIHEVKGKWTRDARTKIKLAAVLFPEFIFKGFCFDQKRNGEGGVWTEERFFSNLEGDVRGEVDPRFKKYGGRYE